MSGGRRSSGQPGRTKANRRTRTISTEEAALWDQVTRDAAPLDKTKSRVVDGSRQHGDVPPVSRPIIPAAKPQPPRLLSGPAITGASELAGFRSAAVTRPKPPPTAIGFDRRKARKIAAGRFAIEARIDLHGMRQHEAHAVLRQFLFDCFAKGRRTVLVITGKGAQSSGRRDGYDGFAEFGGDSGRGVLKRNVPRWLAEPDLAAIVVSHTDAHARQGGEGALYVQLRNRSKPQPTG